MNDFYAMYTYEFDTIECDITNNDIEITEEMIAKGLVFFNEVIFINLSKINDMNFLILASALCHEMIHFYDRVFGEYKTVLTYNLLNAKYDKKIDSHTTPTFKDKMKRSHELKINVIPDARMISFDEYKQQSKDLACKGYKSILEKDGKRHLDLSDVKSVDELVVIGKHRVFGYDKF